MRMRRSVKWLTLIAGMLVFGGGLVFWLVSGGTPELVPTPNLYADSETNPFTDVPVEFRNNQVDVLYVTDRRRIEGSAEDMVAYDFGRSPSMAFGSAVIQYGENVTWDELVKASRSRKREGPLPRELVKVEEKGRFPPTPWPFDPQADWTDHRIHYDPKVVAEHERVAELFRNDVRSRLAKTPRKDVYVFVHGYNNDFEHAVSVIAAIWHFLPRQGVPIAYTWPAGMGGLRGYFYDRESGEYTIFHLKEIMRILANIPEIEKIHFIAHSRGSDVLLTALREILIERGGRDYVPPGDRKLGNVIIAAPDLDLEAISQRITAEEVPAKIDHLTVYMSKSDEAIGFSTWLFVSQKRVGRIVQEDLSDVQRQRGSVMGYGGGAFVSTNLKAGFIGHSYFYSNPAALSDIILILRDNRDPGEASGRPLVRLGPGFWRLDDGYPTRKPAP
ncbi:MAG TPA: alpha/beta hydrolase [Candidatus Polarisedimenticolia bacterium]|nr:alpha/beta hydrolase [Candidatus Polarisedimenticolia bacterium]